jgi:hypothetical protein
LIVTMPPLFLVDWIAGGGSLGFWPDAAPNGAMWTLTLAFAVAVNTAVEGGILAMFKLDLNQRIWFWLAAANTVSVGAALIAVFLDPVK